MRAHPKAAAALSIPGRAPWAKVPGPAEEGSSWACGDKPSWDVTSDSHSGWSPEGPVYRESVSLFKESCSVLLLLLSRFSRVRLCATPQTAAHQAPPSMGFSRQEYWSGVPLPSPGDLPDPDIEPGSPTLRQTLYPLSHQGSPTVMHTDKKGKYIRKFGKIYS